MYINLGIDHKDGVPRARIQEKVNGFLLSADIGPTIGDHLRIIYYDGKLTIEVNRFIDGKSESSKQEFYLKE